VLVVCTGNICRSPAAEALLRAGLGRRSGIAVTSAGLEARVGAPMDVPMRRLLQERGLSTTGAAARQLTPELVQAADLVLTMTTEQRAAVVTQVPTAVRRTFTLREFADLAGLAPGEDGAPPVARLRALMQSAPRVRARRQAGPDQDDVEDPFRRPEAAHRRALAAIDDAVENLLAALGASSPNPRTPLSESAGQLVTRRGRRWSTAYRHSRAETGEAFA
jgi:protein-tyrosine phosphatase